MNRRLLLALAAAWLCGGAGAAEVRVAVAANFAVPLQAIGRAFSAASGHELKVSSGATGKLFSQIVAGAPFEVLVAADDVTPKRLIEQGHAVAGSNFTYAVGALVLWSAKPGFVDAQGAVLAKGRFAHLAMANPKLAPYGAAALQVLDSLGLGEALKPKLVTAESIGQAYQFVVTGNAELGFVALSQVMLPGQPTPGSVWRVPPQRHQPLRQDAVLLNNGRDNPAALALLEYLKSEAARKLMRGYGYSAE